MSNSTNPPTISPPVAKGTPSKTAPASAAPPPETSSSAKTSDGTWATLWLTDRDVVVFSVLAAVVFVMLLLRWGQLSGWGREEIEIERMTPLPISLHLDPNEASWVELAQLDGVGEALATRIVEDRETNGPYRTLDELDRVKGIGPKTLERLKPYLRIKPAGGKP